MRPTHLLRASVLSVFLFCGAQLYPQVPTQAPSQTVAPTTAIADSAETLAALLQHGVDLLRSGDKAGFAVLVRQMEIPDYKQWLQKMYPAEKANNWTLTYETTRVRNEELLEQKFAQIAEADGEVAAQKVTDPPEPSYGLDWDMLHLLREPVSTYYATWKSQGMVKSEGIGYFIFVDRGFRWNSLIPPVAYYLVSGGVSSPKLIFERKPEYPKQGEGRKLQGTVVLTVVVGRDGIPHEVRVKRSLQKDLDEKAIDAVSQWRFSPATKDGHPVAVQINVEVNFRLY